GRARSRPDPAPVAAGPLPEPRAFGAPEAPKTRASLPAVPEHTGGRPMATAFTAANETAKAGNRERFPAFCTCRDSSGLGDLALDPGHEVPHLPADLFELVVGLDSLELLEVLALLGLGHPLLREGAVLDLGQDALHLGAGLLIDDPRAARDAAVLGGVRDRVPHVRQAALVDYVHDQLELVQALEVGGLRRVAGLHQGLEARA